MTEATGCRDEQEKPRFSVVVAVRNGAAHLQECLDSIDAQTYPHREVVVIDGGSTDGTVELLRRNTGQRACLAYWISEPDTGVYDAWNKALEHVRGDWVLFLGASDRLLHPGVLDSLAQALRGVTDEVPVVYGRVEILGDGDHTLYALGTPWPQIRQRFLQEMCIPHPATLHRRTAFARYGDFDTNFRIAGDYDWLLRALHGTSAVFIDKGVSAMRVGGLSSDPTRSLSMLWEVRRAQRKAGLRWPGTVWLLALARVLLRTALWKCLGPARARVWLDWGRRCMGQPAYWTRTCSTHPTAPR
ncbi:glycosyltransferase family 2 protein [Candidatus Symbiobacter mobilis]|uniref:Glycosyltransferase n=1 Tax=Candidatus Symbiobacter mobilis CR TaxID=946483 RepID=U5N983_9BURK|nr:glycosyltransferase family 2 protein [Candidatus Symbiobacter mobilis]AGX87850.1 glycosyltransferase [Candidatus Symbiobacter mobilis CR]